MMMMMMIKIIIIMECKRKVIPVTIRATGTISKSFTWYLKAGKQETTENSQLGHCTHTAERTNVSVHTILNL
jgi:hypothetical protein